MQADVGVAADIQRGYDEAMKAFGKVDILVNNAGTSRAAPFEKLTDEILQLDIEQKLFAAIRLIRLVSPQMKERRWGRIINVLNIGAKAPRPNSMPTSLSRAAGMALTKALASEFAPHNVLVNAMLVGLIEADQHVQAAKRTNVPLADYYKARAARRFRSAASARPRNSPISPASSPPTPAPTSPAPRPTSTAAARRWCRSWARKTEPHASQTMSVVAASAEGLSARSLQVSCRQPVLRAARSAATPRGSDFRLYGFLPQAQPRTAAGWLCSCRRNDRNILPQQACTVRDRSYPRRRPR